jgi:CHAT domain-containing protein
LGKQIVGEGLEGFSSSLFVAGASQLVLALNRIDGEASSEFFANTFDAYLSANSSMERSMTLARQKMASSKDWSDVYYWASFVVIGRPTGPSDAHGHSSLLNKLSQK